MNKNLFLLIISLLTLAACGPSRVTEYNYITPENHKERKCVMKCQIQKQTCVQKEEEIYQRCVNKAKENLYRCQKNYNEVKDYKHCHDNSDICSKSEICEPSYRECFKLCGGRVQQYTYPVDWLGRRTGPNEYSPME